MGKTNKQNYIESKHGKADFKEYNLVFNCFVAHPKMIIDSNI